MPQFSSDDHRYMATAIQLAKKGQYTTHPNPRVGCVIVKDNKVIGKGWHKKAGEAHAEINALADCGIKNAKDATAYVTLEPCFHTGKTPPCSQALLNAGVKRVVAAMLDPNPLVAGQGLQQLKAAGIETASGLLESEARALNPGFIKRMEHDLPFVSVKLAMSLDGRTAMASGESKWITGEAARKDVQFLRAKSSAILTGQGTVVADNPSMNVRLAADELGITGDVRQPIRIILDSHLTTPINSQIFGLEGRTLILNTSDNAAKIEAFTKSSAELVPIEKEKGSDRIPLKAALTKLAKEYEINEIHVEAGATLCGALLQEDLVDELIIYMAPHIMGSDARGLLNLPGLEQMKDKINLEIVDIRAIGKDWRIIARPTTS